MPPFCLPKPLTGHSLTLSAYQGIPRWLGVQPPLGFQRPQPLASRPHQLARTAGEIGGVSLNGPPSLGRLGEYAVPMDLPGTGHSERANASVQAARLRA